jgi:hypothetical protein
MRTVFETITTNNVSKSSLDVLHELLSCSDFDSRAGQRVYLNWIERVSKEQAFGTIDSLSRAVYMSSLIDLIARRRFLDVCKDLAKRHSNFVFIEHACILFLRDFVPLSIEGADESDIVLVRILVDLMHLHTRHMKGRSSNELSNHRSFFVFGLLKLGFCLHYYPQIDIHSLMVEMLQISGDPGDVRTLFIESGMSDFWLMLVALTKKGLGLPPLPSDLLNNVSSLISEDMVPSQCIGMVPAHIARQLRNRTKSGSSVSFFDVFLLGRWLVVSGNLNALNSISSYVGRTKLTPFETMVIRSGIVGRLVVHPGDVQSVEAIIAGITDPQTQLFMYKALEYLCAQMTTFPKWATADKRQQIQLAFMACLSRVSNKEFVKQLIIDNCPDGVRRFLGKSIEKSPDMLATPKPSVPTHPPSMPAESDQLTKLLDTLKRRRLQ